MIRHYFGALFVTLVIVCGPARADGGDAAKRVVTVTGSGEVVTLPDIAMISTSVVSEAADARTAVAQNSDAVRSLFAALRNEGIAERDMQTGRFDLSPRYARGDGARPRSVAGYRAVNAVTVRIRDLDRLGALLDRVVAAGANRISGIRFMIDRPQPLLDEARRKAMADARRKARLYAEAAGGAIKRVMGIVEHGARIPRPMLRGAILAEAAKASAVPIATGEGVLRASVSVTYELE